MISKKNLKFKDINEEKIKDGSKYILLKGKRYFAENKVPNRYILEIDILSSNSSKTLIVIMFNPSEYKKGNIFVDQTVTNVVKIANDAGYKFVKILNLITIISSNPKNIKKDEIIDVDFLMSEIDDSDILVAWGERGTRLLKKNQNTLAFIKKLKTKNVYTFCKKESQTYPKHPARIDIDCCRNCHGRKNKFTLQRYFFE